MLDAASVRQRRGPKRAVDAWAPPDLLRETERAPGGALVAAVAVFLVGAECPFTCVFCDLWRGTLDVPTPPGALPRQLDAAAVELGGWPDGAVVKLYNASNFFDPGAVPIADRSRIARRLRGAGRVVLECHPRLLDDVEVASFAEAVAPARLEVALGLETSEPEVHRRLEKGTTVELFETAAARLERLGVDWRAFVLAAAPFTAAERRIDAAVDSARWAAVRGARHVAMIPTRSGNGTMELLERGGEWSPPGLAGLEEALARGLRAVDQSCTVLVADEWDLERISTCDACFGERQERIARMNRTGVAETPAECARCR